MKRLLTIAAVGLIGLVGLAGCSLNRQVPHTSISGKVGGQPFEISTPKDSDLSGLHVSAETNGTVRVDIEHLSATMNPTNVTATGTAEAQIISATAEAFAKGVQAGAAAAGAAFGAAAKTP